MKALLLRHATRIALVALLVLGVSLYALIPNPLFNKLEQTAYDQLISWTEVDVAEKRVVLVDIDEKSIAAQGAWPWPRKSVASLIRTLTDFYQVGVLGVDIVFPEAKPDDNHLRDALGLPNVVFSQVLDFSEGSENQIGAFKKDPGVMVEGFPRTITGFIANHPQLMGTYAKVGHISPIIDSDGKVRRIYPVVCGAEGCTPTLSLKMLEVIYGAPIKPKRHQNQLNLGLTGERFPLGLDQDGAIYIPYRVKSGGFQYLSASAVMQHSVPKEMLGNAIVILGSTSLGLGDYVATPTRNITPGLELHAQLIRAWVDRDFFTPIQGVRWVTLSCLIIGLTYLFWPWRSTRGMMLWGLLLMLIVAAVTIVLFIWQHWLIKLTPMPLMVAMTLFLGLALESIRLNRQLRVVGAQFSRFIPESLVKRLLRGRELGPNSERRELSVLVADMRGFTTASEGKSPDAVAALAQKCLETLTQVVYQYGGTIEKYSGDGLMAVWGAPKRDLEHAKHAVEAGLQMQVAVKGLKDWFRQNGFEPMRVSVGINTGEGAVGIFGGEAHLAWTAHGDAVNVASRIEQLTRVIGVDLLIGRRTAELYGLANTKDCGEHQVKGRIAPVKIYQIDL